MKGKRQQGSDGGRGRKIATSKRCEKDNSTEKTGASVDCVSVKGGRGRGRGRAM